MADLLHSKLGKYTLDEELGAGGMGAVYRSFHPQLNRPVAIKIILGNATSDARQRFVREAQMAAQLSHPQIVRVFDVDEANGIPYLVMELIEGPSLANLLNEGTLTLAESIRIALQLAEALHYAHERGVLHRDLKPANVLLRPDGDVVLVDFGLARLATVAEGDQLTQTGMILGTLAYMSPEQLLARPLDRRTDIYALGVVLYRMVTGRLPFEGDTAQIMYGHVHTPPPAPHMTGVLLPPALETLLMQMLAKDPAQRVASMADVAAQLRRFQQPIARAVATTSAYTGPTQIQATLPTQAMSQPYGSAFHPQPVAGPTAALPTTDLRKRTGLLMGLGGLVAVVVAVYLLAAGNPAQPPPTPVPEVSGISTEQIATPEEDSRSRPTARPTATRTEATPLPVTQPTPDGQASTSGPSASGSITYTGVSYKRVQSFLANKEEHLWFYGLVKNEGAEVREGIELTITLYDAANKELDYDTGYPNLSYLAPGGHTSFLVIFDREIAAFDHYAIQIRSNPEGVIASIHNQAFEISDVKFIDSSIGSELRGVVKNTGPAALQFVTVHAILFNGEGEVINTASSTVAQDPALKPGETAKFEVSIFEQYERYELQAEGLKE